MKTLTLIFMIGCSVCRGQQFSQTTAFKRASVPQGGAAAFTPSSIPGMAYWWDHNDFSVGGTVSVWTDKIQSWSMTYDANSGGYGTNTAAGVIPDANVRSSFTNSEFSLPSVFSMWIVATSSNPGTYNAVIGSDASGFQSVFFLPCILDDFDAYNNGHQDSFAVVSGVSYDVLWANGTVYTNGVASISTAGLTGTKIGSIMSCNGGSWKFVGAIKFIGIYTNTVLTAQNASDLYSYSTAH